MKEQLLSSIDLSHFKVMSEYGDNLIKLEHVNNQKTISTIFLDYENQSMSVENALKKHEDIISKEYFSAEGNLQWNFYYYFILDKEKYLEAEKNETLSEIEKNTSYSRKRVVSIDYLNDHYPFSSLFENLNDTTDQARDLESEWINILRSYDLDEVYSDAQYVGAVERYLLGSPIKETVAEEDENNSDSEGIEITSLSKIELIDYRSFQKGISFDFSSVNLIEGVNGTGKTSLIEAIELALCGVVFRQEGLAVENAEIKIWLKNPDRVELYSPKNLKKYKAREFSWYGIPASSNKNKLHHSFNRFNFFNTDSSFRFSTGTEADAIWNSFTALALGKETTELDKRIVGFESRFSDIKNKTERESNDLKTEIKRYRDQKESIQLNSEVKVFDAKQFEDVLAILGQKFQAEAILEDHLNEYSRIFSNVIVKTKSLILEFSLREVDTLKEIELQCLENQKIINDLKIFDANSLSLKKEISESRERAKVFLVEKSYRERFDGYLESEEAFGIFNLENGLIALDRKIIKIQSLVNLIKLESLIVGPFDNEEIESRVVLLEASKASLTFKFNQVEIRIKAIQESFESYKTVVAEIKSLGKKFLTLSPSNICPMCEHEQDRAILEIKINNLNMDFDDLSKDLEERSGIREEIQKTDLLLQELILFKDAIERLDLDVVVSKLKISEIKKILKNELSSLQVAIEKSEGIKRVLNLLEQKNISSLDFRLILDKLEISNLENKEKLKIENQARLSKLKEDIVNAEKLIENNRIKLRENADVVFSNHPQFRDESFYDEEKSNNFLNYGNLVSGISAYKSFIQEFPAFNEKENVANFSSLVSKSNEILLSHILYLSNQKQQSSSLKEIEKIINEKEVILKDVDEKFNRANRAIEAFLRISTECNKEEAISNFFNRNKSLILKIFREIHSPNEFEDIQLSDQKILVVKNGVERDLKTISTGQRTAVALSLFLGLHLSCPKAPRIILFDDPMAFVDDLNVLAFLDFLRELATRGERQIFFATANGKLASLFKRKFDVVGTDSLKVLTPKCGH